MTDRPAPKDDTIYISDLDGTLLNSDGRLSDTSVCLLNEAIGGGAQFSVATARTPATVAGIFSDVSLRLPMVVMTGAAIWDPVSDRYLMTRTFPEETAREIIALYRGMKFPSFVYTMRDHHLHVYHIGPLNDDERAFMKSRSGTPFKTFHVPPDGESQLPGRFDNVVLFCTMQPEAAGRAVYERVRHRTDMVPNFYRDDYGTRTALMEIFPKDATKAKAIETLADSLGLSRTVVFGDNVNDLPMMRAATEAIAVGNALPEVKELADEVIGDNTDDAVAKAILRMSKTDGTD